MSLGFCDLAVCNLRASLELVSELSAFDSHFVFPAVELDDHRLWLSVPTLADSVCSGNVVRRPSLGSRHTVENVCHCLGTGVVVIEAAFFNDLHWAPLTKVLNCTDPDKALATWYNVYLTVVSRHAPLRRKRVKHPKLPPWLNKDIKETMAERGKLKREKWFPEYKKFRNKVKISL